MKKKLINILTAFFISHKCGIKIFLKWIINECSKGTCQHDPIRDDNGVGQGRRMGSSSPPRMVLSCPIPAPPRITGNTFSPHPRPLGFREASSHPEKLYFLLICPTTSTIFLMKLISLIKIYLKLQIYPIKLNQFLEKKLNNISKCLTRQS